MGSRRWKLMHPLSDLDCALIVEDDLVSAQDSGFHERLFKALLAFYTSQKLLVRFKIKAGLQLLIITGFEQFPVAENTQDDKNSNKNNNKNNNYPRAPFKLEYSFRPGQVMS